MHTSEVLCVAPDLTRPENLHYLLEVADAVKEHFDTEDAYNFADLAMHLRAPGESRTAAVIAACCAALGIEINTCPEHRETTGDCLPPLRNG
jgi:hypothetical protein